MRHNFLVAFDQHKVSQYAMLRQGAQRGVVMQLPPNTVTSLGDEGQVETTHQDMEMRLRKLCPASPNIYTCILFPREVYYMVTRLSLCLMSRKSHNIIAFVLRILVSPMLNSLHLIRTECKTVKFAFPKKYFRVMYVNLIINIR